ncbi:hypothetical protein AZE42_09845, partial [Rhizopogon vesiculosus]
QIKIFKPGSSIACSGFKRRNAREEPFDIVGAGSGSAHTEICGSGQAEKKSKASGKQRGFGYVMMLWRKGDTNSGIHMDMDMN